MPATRRDRYVRDMTPAERSAAWVLELWLLDAPTRRYLAGRFTPRADLYAAYRDSLRVPQSIQDAARWDGDGPSLVHGTTNWRPDDATRHRHRIAVLRGSHAGSIVDAGSRVFNRIARLYLLESYVHGEPGWCGIAGWRGLPVDLGAGLRTPVRRRDLVQDGDSPLWTRIDECLETS